MDGWMDGNIKYNRWTDGWVDDGNIKYNRWTDGWMDAWKYKVQQMDR